MVYYNKPLMSWWKTQGGEWAGGRTYSVREAYYISSATVCVSKGHMTILHRLPRKSFTVVPQESTASWVKLCVTPRSRGNQEPPRTFLSSVPDGQFIPSPIRRTSTMRDAMGQTALFTTSDQEGGCYENGIEPLIELRLMST